MGDSNIGVAAGGGSGADVLARIETLEKSGIDAVWLTTGGAGPDGLTILGAAAARTERILLGTSIVPTWPRHPIVAAQQTQVIESIAPGRFRLGLGPSHAPAIARPFGIEFERVLSHLREYVHVVRTLLHDGTVEFDGERLSAHASIPIAYPGLPVMASALRQRSFEFTGAATDGAISWMCPLPYLRDVAIPAMKAGAESAGRSVPPLVAHIPLTVHADPGEVRAAAREQFAVYARLPFYQSMFAASGYPEASESGEWSDRMVDEIVAYGSDERVAQRINDAFDLGASEVLVTVLTAGSDPEGTWDRTVGLLGELSSAS
ncbi:MAG: LLM class flavin-dependent oxidoreductase [Chloroflexi bacterium]|nr:LLM class flavin-dependent oxidoreductase [Chloroflexota bacterium]